MSKTNENYTKNTSQTAGFAIGGVVGIISAILTKLTNLVEQINDNIHVANAVKEAAGSAHFVDNVLSPIVVGATLGYITYLGYKNHVEGMQKIYKEAQAPTTQREPKPNDRQTQKTTPVKDHHPNKGP